MKRGKERNQKEKRKEKTFSFGVFGYRMERKEEVMNTFVWFTFSNFMIEKNISKVMSYLSLPFYPIWVESKILRPSKKISLQIKSLFPSLIQPNQGNSFSSLLFFSLSSYFFQSKYSLRLCLVWRKWREKKTKE